MKCQNRVDSEAIRSDIFEQKIPVCPKCCPSGQLNIDFDAAGAVESEEEDLSIFPPSEVTTDSEPSSAQPRTAKPEKDVLPIIKPDIVFFGEGLPEEFHSSMSKDKDACDLVIVIGSSLKVRPVALIPCEYTAVLCQDLGSTYLLTVHMPIFLVRCTTIL
jgi:NAD-dependent SIR2 family protein deacetylase